MGGNNRTLESWCRAPLLASNAESLVADLRSILSPQFVVRARDVAALMTKATESVAKAADLLEEAARH
jgi:UDP:flavonoid glycosyltransferase YjiC (YdhE family)